MSLNVTRKLIESHLESGDMTPGEEIAIRIDQTLTQDATGTLVMQELEALGLDRARTELSVQYVDHNLLQTDEKNAEDHEYLRTAAQRFGLWFSKPGNGVSHPTHMQRFGIPGKTMVGSDSHTPAAGSLGMLASVWAGWRWRWPSPGDRCTSACPGCGVCVWKANCRNGARPRTSSSKCCAVTTSRAG